MGSGVRELGLWGSGVTVMTECYQSLRGGEEHGCVGLERCVGLVGDRGGR